MSLRTSLTNPAIIVTGALTVFAGFTVTQPLIIGSATVFGGAASLSGNAVPKPGEGTNGGKALGDKVLDEFKRLDDFITNANGGVFGIEGFNPGKAIPGEVQRQSFKIPSVRALGDGQWLNADPAVGLKEMMDEMHNRMKQVLACSMLRDTRRTFVFADRPPSKEECEELEGARDPEEKVCFRLFWATDDAGSSSSVNGIHGDLTRKITSKPYNLDLLEASRNAYNCWRDHGRRPAHPDTESRLEPGQLPKCLFGMVAVSGTYEEGVLDGKIHMDGWAGQTKDEVWDPKDDRA